MSALIEQAPKRLEAADLADPRRDIRAGIGIAVLFFVIFLGWAAFTRLDAAAYAQGTLVVSGERQAVQHRDGGVVASILVREGQRVERGQLLMTLAAAEVRAQAEAYKSQAIKLLAQRARLEAEQLNAATLAQPAEYARFDVEDRPAIAAAMRLQQAELNARRATLTAQRGVLGQQGRQSGAQGRGYASKIASLDEQIRLTTEQIEALRPVAERGFVSKTRMRDLERMRADLTGQRGQFRASVAQTADARRQTEFEALQAEQSFRERTVGDLRETEVALGELLPKLNAAHDQLARTEIRAPATGAVVGLAVFTQGGVIAAGQKLMDVVPENTPLQVQARIDTSDADDLSTGQVALVRFPSLHERTLPNLEGMLTRVSADSFTDDKTGASYFTAEVMVPPEQLERLKRVRGPDFALRAGLPVEVLIRLRPRTALDYALEPLTGSFWSTMREQ